MSKTDTQIVSFRLPTRLVAALDKIVKKRSPEIKDRTQYVEIKLTEAVARDDNDSETCQSNA
jgi:hypothetical protein